MIRKTKKTVVFKDRSESRIGTGIVEPVIPRGETERKSDWFDSYYRSTMMMPSWPNRVVSTSYGVVNINAMVS